MADTYLDPVKDLSRDKLSNFINTSILRVKKPKDVHALCFPGAEADGQEGLELRIYDQNRIPRQNITGLECDRERAARLERANLGITVVPSDSSAYFSSTTKKFNIISLDYTGQKDYQVTSDIRAIARRGLLGTPGVLCVNNMAGREKGKTRNYLALASTINNIQGTFDPRQNFLNAAIAIMTAPARLDEETLPESRDQFSKEIMQSLFLGTIDHLSMIDRKPADSILFAYPRSYETHTQFVESAKKMNIPDDLTGSLLLQLHREHLLKWIADQLTKDLNDPQQYASTYHATNALIGMYSESYLTNRIERYSYISNSGTRMEMDILEVQNLKRFRHRLQSSVSIVMEGGQPVLRINSRTKNDIVALNDICRTQYEYEQHTYATLPLREHLGSSCQRKAEEEKTILEEGPVPENSQPNPPNISLSKEEAIGLLQDGFKPDDILKEYPEWTKRRLGALLAHVSRGTYKKTSTT